MTIANNEVGQVREATMSEAMDLFERRCREELKVSADEFLAAHEAGSYPQEWDASSVSRVEFLLPFAR